jgi:hypothetical protein
MHLFFIFNIFCYLSALFFARCHPLQLTDNFQTLYILASDTYNVYVKLALFSHEEAFSQEHLEEQEIDSPSKEFHYSANI